MSQEKPLALRSELKEATALYSSVPSQNIRVLPVKYRKYSERPRTMTPRSLDVLGVVCSLTSRMAARASHAV